MGNGRKVKKIEESLERNAIEPVLVAFVCQSKGVRPRDTEEKRKTEIERFKAGSRITTPTAFSAQISIP